MGYHSKYILLIGLLAWVTISCNDTNSNADSDQLTSETELLDSVSQDAPAEMISELDDTVSNPQTDDRISSAQQKLRDQLEQSSDDDQPQSPSTYRLDVAPYNYFADRDGFVSFQGRTLEEIQHILGEAPIVVKQSVPGAPIRKEVRVYLPYKEDPTGLYLFIQNEVVLDFKLDEFNGIQNSSVLEFFESR